MLVRGWVLRLNIDTRKNLLLLSIKSDNGEYRERGIRYRPKLYVTGPRDELQSIVRANSEYILDFDVEKWFLPPWYDVEKNMYVLTMTGPKEYYRLIDIFRKDGRWILWNLTPTLDQRFLYENGISVSTHVEIKIGNGFEARTLENIRDISYHDPPFNRVAIRLMDWYGDVLNPWLKPPKWIEIYHDSSSTRFRTLGALEEFIREVDPDVIEYIGRHTLEWLMGNPSLRHVLYSRMRV